MKKHSRAVSIETDEGDIFIIQDDSSDEKHQILLHPDQVPLLIRWLNEAVKSIEVER